MSCACAAADVTAAPVPGMARAAERPQKSKDAMKAVTRNIEGRQGIDMTVSPGSASPPGRVAGRRQLAWLMAAIVIPGTGRLKESATASRHGELCTLAGLPFCAAEPARITRNQCPLIPCENSRRDP